MSDSDQPKPKPAIPPRPSVTQNLRPDVALTWPEKLMYVLLGFLFFSLGALLLAFACRIVTVGLK